MTLRSEAGDLEGHHQHLSVHDVGAAVELVSAVCDPGSSATVTERRGELCRRLGELVEADVWVGAVGVSSELDPVDSPCFAMYDGGWKNDAERLACFRVFVDRRLNELVNTQTVRAFVKGGVLTYRRHDVIPEATWSGDTISKMWNALGFDQFMLTIYPMPDRYYSALGLHRRLGRPPFSLRDRTLVHAVWTQTEWLHQREMNFPVGHKIIELSVREREVVLLMLAGDNADAAAAKMGLSEHTVRHYLKSIYRKLGVGSRSELVANYLPK